MAQREPSRATIEEDIEETQRQIRRSAELIQSAFEGLSTLHGRVTDLASLRAQGRTPASSSQSRTSAEGTSGGSGSGDRSAMDPGHDAILLSTPSYLPAAPAESPAAAASPPELGRPRTSDPALSNLRSEILQSTESVRSRAGELDELRRAISLHAQDRQRQEALQRILLDSPHRPGAGSSARDLPVLGLPPNHTPISSLPARSRRQLLESSLRQRSDDDSATSLGAMVTMRAETRRLIQRTAGAGASSSVLPSASPVPDVVTFTPNASVPPLPVPTSGAGRPHTGSMPPGFATRLSRLAQEIQQDISRISLQSESLMSWINEHRTRLDAGLAAVRPSERAADRSPSPSANRTPRPSHASIAVAASATSAPSERGVRTSSRALATRGANSIASQAGSNSRTGSDGGEAAPRRPPRRHLAAMPAAHPREAHLPGGLTDPSILNFRSLMEDRDGPLSRSSRMDGSPPSSTTQIPAASTSAPGAGSALSPEEQLAQSVARARNVLARARQSRRHGGEDEDEPTETRSYRVRRRLNADGDEEETRVPVRPLRDWRRGSDASARDGWDFDDDDADARRAWAEGTSLNEDRNDAVEDDTAWYSALRRLSALSRDRAGAQAWEQRWDSIFRMDDEGSPLDANGDEAAYPVSLGRNAALSSMNSYRQHLASRGAAERSGEYERSRAAMVARAQALTSSMTGTGAFSRTSALPPPPPPPAVRPFSLVSTTQTTPGSLWNDSGVRVRIRSAVQRLDEDMRALDAARDRVSQSTPQQGSSQSLSRAPFWPPEYGDATTSASSSSSSLLLERSSVGGAAGGTDLEQPVWGSPTPFYPSPLPLPRVEEVSSLQARSRAFGGAKKIARMPRRRAPVVGR